MGYRSHCVMAVETEKLVLGLVKHPDIAWFFEEADRKFEDETTTYVEHTYTKWYDSYPEVSAVCDWMSEMENESRDSETYEEPPFQFMRQGEEGDDFEHLGSWQYELIGHGLSLEDLNFTRIHHDKINEIIKLVEGLECSDRICELLGIKV